LLTPKREKPKAVRAFTIRVIFSLSVSDGAEYESTHSGQEHRTLADRAVADRSISGYQTGSQAQQPPGVETVPARSGLRR
jgi:hypothetical protein